MKMPMSHIWKSAAETARRNAERPDSNLHIGRTMRDLYAHNADKQSKNLDSLLEKLKKTEPKPKR
ncbi:hypothetical protein LPJGGPFB_01100 [Ensifer adhaerens]|nr:hypothetical protein [Ensifer adhaerens]